MIFLQKKMVLVTPTEVKDVRSWIMMRLLWEPNPKVIKAHAYSHSCHRR